VLPPAPLPASPPLPPLPAVAFPPDPDDVVVLPVPVAALVEVLLPPAPLDALEDAPPAAP
jgi:hypothetical protein